MRVEHNYCKTAEEQELNEHDRALEGLKKILQSIQERNADELANNPSHGDLKLTEAHSSIESAISLAKDVLVLPLEILPTVTLLSLTNPTKTMSNVLTLAANFRIDTPNAKHEKTQLVGKIDDNLGEFHKHYLHVIPYLLIKKKGINTTQLRLKALVEDLEVKKEELGKKLLLLNDALAESAVSRNSEYFCKVATAHKKSSKTWLVIACILAVATVAIAIAWPFLVTALELNPLKTAEGIATRIIIVSLMSFSVVWSSRIYRAHRHLYVVNTHRQTALQTFQSFFEATKDPDIKNAVLLAATRCIFSPSASGFLGGDQDNSGTNIVEIIGKATEKASTNSS